jgi:cell division protein FtsB
MNFRKIKQNKYTRLLLNKYIWVGLFFVIWMVFLDTNSLLVHYELSDEIDKLDKRKSYYQSELKSDKRQIKSLQQPFQIEKYARKNFYMKRPEEDIFIIEFEDSLKD